MKKAKKRNKKSILKILIILFVILVIGIGIYYFLTSEDEENSLTIIEKQWIENNKNNLIDIEVPNNLGIISNNGKGVIFEFLSYLEETTGLKFNKISYDYPNYIENEKQTLSIATLKNNTQIKDNDMLILEDVFVVISKDNSSYNNESFLNNTVIGVLNTDEDIVSKYFSNKKVTIKTGKNFSDLESLLKTGNVNYYLLYN